MINNFEKHILRKFIENNYIRCQNQFVGKMSLNLNPVPQKMRQD